MDTLVPDIHATHDVLKDRLEAAAATTPTHDDPRARYPATDTFLASASRHQAAVLAALVPQVRKRLPDGRERSRAFIRQSRALEAALAQVKAKLYGSSYAVRRSWDSVWSDARRELEATWRLEEEMLGALAEQRREGDPDFGEMLHHAELHSPTRPHPYVPHRGIGGRLARGVALRIDRFWDTTEGRMVPEPVRHHDREKDGKLAQYLLADPHLPDD